MTPANVWFTIGGYQAFNLYGSDDGHYSRDCFRNGYIMGYVEEISFFHPINQDTGYSEWKYKAISNELKDDNKKGFYENHRGT